MKWYGKIGYCTMEETSQDVWEEVIKDRMYPGEVARQSRRAQTNGQVNDNIAITMQLSILADPYAVQHFQDIRYAEVWGTKWKIQTAEVNYPRLILNLGEEYHERQEGTG